MVTHSESLVDRLSQIGLSPAIDLVPEVPEDGFIAQWPTQSIVRLTGPAARKFLQGQLTCQIDELSPSRSLLAAACTPKGKALANFRLVVPQSDTEEDGSPEILLRISSDLEQSLLSHFQKYLAFFKAKMETAEDWSILGLTGERAFRALGIDWHGEPGDVQSWHRSLMIGTQPDALGRRRVELWLNSADLSELESGLQGSRDGQILASQSAWLAGEIQGGLTSIDERLQDRYVPQYFNWHAIDGISFRKGCYTGQEIIARMRYLGQLKKSTYRVLLPQGGADVLAVVTDATGRAVGEITNLVAYPNGSQEALAVIKHTATSSSLQLADTPESPVLLGALPYSVPEQEAPSEK